MRDLETFIAGLHDYIAKAIAPLRASIDGLEKSIDGLKTFSDDIQKSIEDRIKSLEEREPVNGKDADEDAILVRLESYLDQKSAAIKWLVDELGSKFDGLLRAEDLCSLPKPPTIEEVKAAVLAEMPAPQKGEKGEDGKSFTIEEVRALVRDAVEQEQAKWALEFERRAQDTLRSACDRIPVPQNGRDGLGFEDMTLEHDGERKFALVFSRDGREVRKEFSLPVVLDRGYYERGKSYAPGDGVTSKGSFWIAQVDTDLAPGESDDWRKAVSKGRDARMVEMPKSPTGPVRLGAAE